MTPKEKADELVRKYTVHSYRGSAPLNIHVQSIKNYALIAVEEILKITWVDSVLTVQDYWNEVKQEIKNL